MTTAAAWVIAGHVAFFTGAAPQALPPPRDGDIRVLYWEIQNQTEVWLTLEPKQADGKRLPPLVNLTLSLSFAGKRPAGAPEYVELRAYTGMMWSPQVELWLAVDGDRIGLARDVCCLTSGGIWDYVTARVPIDKLERIARAKRVTGNALGLEFELTASQRHAVRAFHERVTSRDPTAGALR